MNRKAVIAVLPFAFFQVFFILDFDMYKIIRVFWLLSVVGFFVAFLVTYANIEEFVRIKFQAETEGITIGRDLFFYFGLGIFLVLNIVLYIFARILRNLPKPKPQQSLWLADLTLRQRLINWLLSFALIFNLLLIFAVFLIGNISDSFAREDISLNGWLYTTGAFFTVWMVALLFIFARRH